MLILHSHFRISLNSSDPVPFDFKPYRLSADKATAAEHTPAGLL